LIVNKKSKRAVSETIGAVIMLLVLLAAFSVVYVYYSSAAQRQSQSVMQQYQSGAIKAGQLVSLIYNWNDIAGDTVKVGLYNFGLYNVTLGQVFVNGTQQSSWALTYTNGNAVKCICVAPGVMDVLTITSISGIAETAVKNGNYELFLYATDNLAYVWEL